LLSLPNIVTLLRLAAVPVIVALSYSRSVTGIALAAVAFAAAAITDWLDGYLARRLGAHTPVGALLDPVTDKVMVLAMLFVLWDVEVLPLWLVLVNAFREAAVTAVRHAASTPQRIVGANRMGKAKFVLQVVVVELAYLHLLLLAVGRPLPGGRQIVFWAAVATTAISLGFLARFTLIHRVQLFTVLARRSDKRHSRPGERWTEDSG